MTAPLHPPPRMLVVIPAWNEERSVGAVVTEVKATLPDADVLVVDDGSGDSTSAAAERTGALVCRLPFNLGVGGAMRAGYRYAQRHDYDVVVQVDADGQHDPSYIATLVDELDTADVVIGARFAGVVDYRVRGPRRWAMAVLAPILSWLAGTRLTDVTSGYRAANRRALQVFATHYPTEYLGDTVESLVIALRTGCTVRQVPVEMRVRTAGIPSQNPLRSSAYLLRAVSALLLALVRQWPVPVPSEGVA
jgi:glycosyltransferase involved in cell wall biosynthesis